MSKLLFRQFIFVAGTVLFSMAAVAQAVVYPFTKGLKPSEEYEVKVNGKDVFVYASPVPAAYCSFDIEGPVEIWIKAKRDIKWVDVRPLSAGVKTQFKDSIIVFKISKPCQLSIELNGSIKSPLFLFANPPEKNKPSKNDPNVIFFEGGTVYNAGSIEPKNNQTVYIEGGAVVVGSIRSKNANNVAIRGRGILDGTWNRKFDDSLVKLGQFDKLVVLPNEENYRRSIEMLQCNNLLIEGIIVHNSTTWTVVPENCDRVEINNVKLISDQPSDDGIDIAHSQHVWVHNSFIRTKDDCIAVKSYNKGEQDVDSVLVEKCIFWNALWGNGLEIGFELNSNEVRNITFRNCDVVHVEMGAVFSIHNAGTATVKNILFDNIRIEDAKQKLFDLAIFRSRYSEDGPATEEETRRLYLFGAWDGVISVPAEKKNYHEQFRGTIKNVVFRNINIVDGLFPFSVFYGFSNTKNISGVSIENLTVHGKKITSLNEAKLTLENASSIGIK